jgi:hypothetical protein
MVSETYYLDRFVAICAELELDAKKVLSAPPPMLSALIRQWMTGKINDVELMRSLRNLGIMNSQWRSQP